MKKITLLVLALCLVQLGFAQEQQYLFDFEPDGPDGVASNWVTFDNTPPPATIIDNPDLDGTNATLSKVLRVQVGPGNAFYAGVNNVAADAKFGTWSLPAIGQTFTLSMDINKNYVGTVGIKMGTVPGGTSFTTDGNAATISSSNPNVDNSIVDEWQTLTYEVTITGDVTNVSQMVVYVDWRSEANTAERDPNTVIHIDNITFTATKTSDPEQDTCSDNIQNGEETGVDCGGPTCQPCTNGPTEPTTPAPTPTAAQADVISLFSGAYNDVTVNTFRAGFSSANFEEVNIESNPTLKYTNLDFVGIETVGGNAINATVADMNFINFDIWTPNMTLFRFKLVDFKGDGFAGANGDTEAELIFGTTEPASNASGPAPAQGEWVHFSLPLSDFQAKGMTDFTNITQYIISGNPAGSGTVFVDNLYFSKEATASNPSVNRDNFRIFPNPSSGSWNIVASDVTIQSVDVYSILGSKVFSQVVEGSSLTIDNSALSTGVYLAKVNTASGSTTIKLIKN